MNNEYTVEKIKHGAVKSVTAGQGDHVDRFRKGRLGRPSKEEP